MEGAACAGGFGRGDEPGCEAHAGTPRKRDSPPTPAPRLPTIPRTVISCGRAGHTQFKSGLDCTATPKVESPIACYSRPRAPCPTRRTSTPVAPLLQRRYVRLHVPLYLITRTAISDSPYRHFPSVRDRARCSHQRIHPPGASGRRGGLARPRSRSVEYRWSTPVSSPERSGPAHPRGVEFGHEVDVRLRQCRTAVPPAPGASLSGKKSNRERA